MRLLPFLREIAIFVLVIAWSEKQASLAQQVPGYSPKAKACVVLPVSDLETLYHARADTPRGFDDDFGGSICRVKLGGYEAKAQTAPPGDPGAPHTIQEGFALIPLVSVDNYGKAKLETKDYGKIGCLKLEFSAALQPRKEPKPVAAVSCFLVGGGYLNLSLGCDDTLPITFDTVKQLLEKAAARRKS